MALRILSIGFFLITLLMLLLSGSPLPTQADLESENYVFRRSWGGEAYLFNVADIIVSPEKEIFIISDDWGRVTRIDPIDQTYTTWGKGNFSTPRGITLDADGNIYIADTNHYAIKKYTPTGNLLLEIGGSWGTEPGKLQEPRGIVVDLTGDIYVSDIFYVNKFRSDGTFIKRWGGVSNPGAPGQFLSAEGIALDGFANVYVADSNNHRVQKFDKDGNFLLAWGTEGSENGQFYLPMGVATDNNNNVYVADGHYHIQKFNSNGVFLKSWDVNTCAYWEYTGRLSIVDNNLYIAAGTCVIRYSLDGQFSRQWSTDHDGSGNWMKPYSGIAVAQNGDILTTEDFFVVRYSPFGTLLSQAGGCEEDRGCFNYPGAVEVDNTDNIYIANTNDHEIIKLSSAWTFQLQWGSQGIGNGQFKFPEGLAVDNSTNHVYVIDRNNNRVQKFDSQGVYLTQWGSWGQSNGQFYTPKDIVIGQDQHIYVVDTDNHRIQIFDSNGSYLGRWGNEGEGDGQFQYIQGIAVDDQNHFYVTDENRIQKFTPDGTFVTKWGSLGTGPEQFLSLEKIAVDKEGLVYVIDGGNQRVQVFGKNHPIPDPVSGLIQNGGFESAIALTEWAYGGIPSVSRSPHAFQGNYALLLGKDISSPSQGQSWAYQTLYIDPAWVRPVLTFQYNMFVNDTIDYSDFFVEIQDGVGLNHLATALRDGYQPCIPGTAPTRGTNLGWRKKSYDLSAYKGQYIRLIFSNRNLWPDSLSIWTYVDDVRVIDAGLLPTPGPYSVFMPMLTHNACDPIPHTGFFVQRPTIIP